MIQWGDVFEWGDADATNPSAETGLLGWHHPPAGAATDRGCRWRDRLCAVGHRLWRRPWPTAQHADAERNFDARIDLHRDGHTDTDIDAYRNTDHELDADAHVDSYRVADAVAAAARRAEHRDRGRRDDGESLVRSLPRIVEPRGGTSDRRPEGRVQQPDAQRHTGADLPDGSALRRRSAAQLGAEPRPIQRRRERWLRARVPRELDLGRLHRGRSRSARESGHGISAPREHSHPVRARRRVRAVS